MSEVRVASLGILLAFVLTVSGAAAAGASTRLVQAGGDLQAAINAALPGDTILLQAGATFSGNFLLPVKTGEQYITIRTSTPDASLPPAAERVTPEAVPLLARIQSPNTSPALRTAAGAHHWRIEWLEFGPNAKGYGDVIAIGDGGSAQNSLSRVPYAIALEHLYIHGDRLLGQKRGIALNARDVTIRGCYIGDIKAVGQDTQAIGGWNGPGPYLIENNYLEAAGENVMFGGAIPYINGVIADGITVRGNYVSRPVSWRSPIVATPRDVHALGVAGGGSLPAGTYAYRVVARRPAGQANVARSTASVEVHATVPAGASAGRVTVAWSPVPDATEYYVYGRHTGQTMYWRVTETMFVDTGSTGSSGAVPTSSGTTWTVKNLFELKAARNVHIEFNTFENNWAGAQTGYALVFTPRGQGGACSWCAVENITFQYNVVRHTASAINVLGYDDGSPTPQLRNLVVRHNLFYDVNKTQWGGSGYFLLLGDEPRDVIVDHNTIVHNGSSLVYAYGGTSTAPRAVYGFQFTNNLARHSTYGLASQYFSYGAQALANYFPDAIVKGNLLSGGPSSRYPSGNYFYGDFDAQFAEAAADDYRLDRGSPLVGLANDGTDVGANIEAILAGQGAEPDVAPALDAPPAAAKPAAPGNLRVVR